MHVPDTSVHSPSPTWRRAVGWAVVLLNTATAGLWAFWGAIEAFHEGWWHGSVAANVGWTFVYLVPSAIFVVLGLVGVRWPRLGAALVLAFTAWFWWWWGVPTRLLQGEGVLVGLGMSGVGGFFAFLWWFGRAAPRRWALRITWALPLLTAVASAAFPAWRVAHRIDDGDRGERLVAGNGVQLLWVADGPGWPGRGSNWNEARDIAARLSVDGTTLLDTPSHFWRLPTREEVVRSLTLHGANAGGTLDPATGRVHYRVMPDKETPLWNPRSEVIYWWTADETDENHAWSVAYNGSVLIRRKNNGMGTLGFRAVRDLGS